MRRPARARAWRWAAILAAVPAAALLLEAAWFVYVLGLPTPPLKADMLAVYGGSPARYESAWGLERAGDFKYLVFSDAPAGYVQGMGRRFGPPRKAQVVLEPRAHTTAQNARYVAALALPRGCRSLLVETSWWHLPRALFLTHLALLGHGVRVRGIAWRPATGPALKSAQVWTEGLRFWGSLATFESDTRRSDPVLDSLQDE